MGWEFAVLKHRQQGFAFFWVSMAPLACAGTCNYTIWQQKACSSIDCSSDKITFFLQVTFKSQIFNFNYFIVDILPLTDFFFFLFFPEGSKVEIDICSCLQSMTSQLRVVANVGFNGAFTLRTLAKVQI